MTEQRPHGDPAIKPVTPRHRRSAALSVGAWLAATGPVTRRLLAGGAATVLVLALVLGYLLLNSDGDEDGDAAPPQAGSTGQPVPPASAPPARSGVPPAPAPSGASPNPGGGSAPATPAPAAPAPAAPAPANPAPERTTPPAEAERPARPTARPEPRRVGPANLAEFEKLLSAFCQKRGFRTAVLLDGPEDEPDAGNWVCVEVVEFTAINLDTACRDTLGEGTKARQLKRDDSRTWRCFDS